MYLFVFKFLEPVLLIFYFNFNELNNYFIKIINYHKIRKNICLTFCFIFKLEFKLIYSASK